MKIFARALFLLGILFVTNEAFGACQVSSDFKSQTCVYDLVWQQQEPPVAVGWVVEQNLPATNQVWASIGSPTVKTLRDTIAGDPGNRQICWRVKAYNFDANGAQQFSGPSPQVCQTTPALQKPPVPVPNVPNNFTVTPVSTTALELRWQDVQNELAYEMQRSINSKPYMQLAVYKENTVTGRHTGLSNKSNYCYKIRALGLGGASDQSSPVCAKPSSF